MAMKLTRHFQTGAVVTHMHLDDSALVMPTTSMTTPHDSDKDVADGPVERALESRCCKATLPDSPALTGVSQGRLIPYLRGCGRRRCQSKRDAISSAEERAAGGRAQRRRLAVRLLSSTGHYLRRDGFRPRIQPHRTSCRDPVRTRL